MLDLSTCEGKFDRGNGANSIFRYEIFEDVEYRSAKATKVQIENVIGGVGYEMSIYDIYDRRKVESLASMVSRGKKNLLSSEIEEIQPDIVKISSQFGRFSIPGGAYDVSRSRDLSEVAGIKEPGSNLQNDAIGLYKRAMRGAALAKARGRCK